MTTSAKSSDQAKILVEVEDAKGMSIKVEKLASGLYTVSRKLVGAPDSAYDVKHPRCTADDAIRVLGHYLQF